MIANVVWTQIQVLRYILYISVIERESVFIHFNLHIILKTYFLEYVDYQNIILQCTHHYRYF